MKNLSALFVLMSTTLFHALLGMEVDVPRRGSKRSKTPTYITAHFADGTKHGIRSLEYKPSSIILTADTQADSTTQPITANEDVFSFIMNDLAVQSDQAVFDQLQEFYHRLGQNQLDLCSLEKAALLAQGTVSPSAIVMTESSSPRVLRKNSSKLVFSGPEAVLKIGEFEVARNKEFKVQFPQSGNFGVLSGEPLSDNPVYLQIALSALRTMLKPHATAPKRYCIDLRTFQKEFAHYKQQPN